MYFPQFHLYPYLSFNGTNRDVRQAQTEAIELSALHIIMNIDALRLAYSPGLFQYALIDTINLYPKRHIATCASLFVEIF